MNRWNGFGIAMGLAVAGLSITLGDPSFFTVEHAEIWYEHLDPGRFLPEPLKEPYALAGGADRGVPQWGY
jgi:hypothetical protein